MKARLNLSREGVQGERFCRKPWNGVKPHWDEHEPMSCQALSPLAP